MCKIPEVMDCIQKQTFKIAGVLVEHYPMFYAEQTRPFEIIAFFSLKLTNFQDNLCLVQSKYNDKYYILLYKCVLNYAIPYKKYQVGDILDFSKVDLNGINQSLYDTYEEWIYANTPQYVKNWNKSKTVSSKEQSNLFKIVTIASHLNDSAMEIFLIQSLVTGFCYMIDASFIYSSSKINKIVAISEWFD